MKWPHRHNAQLSIYIHSWNRNNQTPQVREVMPQLSMGDQLQISSWNTGFHRPFLFSFTYVSQAQNRIHWKDNKTQVSKILLVTVIFLLTGHRKIKLSKLQPIFQISPYFKWANKETMLKPNPIILEGKMKQTPIPDRIKDNLKLALYET